ncbi:MAG: hypothetical protein EOM52_12585, partial [Clostridia bacterium]|nr:hypothetical protein [Clostridia bacterium]
MAAKVAEMKAVENVANVSWIGDMEVIRYLSPENYQKIETVFNKDGNYLVLLLLNVSSGEKATGQIVKSIKTILDGTDYELGGTAALNQDILTSSLRELPIYLSIAVILVLII